MGTATGGSVKRCMEVPSQRRLLRSPAPQRSCGEMGSRQDLTVRLMLHCRADQKCGGSSA